MSDRPLPIDFDALEKLVKDSARLVEAAEPVVRELTRLAARVPVRRALPFAAGAAAVALLGVAVATATRRRDRSANGDRGGSSGPARLEAVPPDERDERGGS